MTFVDSNVIIDILADTPVWADWSARCVEDALDSGNAYVNGVVVAEVSRNYTTANALARAFDEMELSIVPFGVETAFLAGNRFVTYRRSRSQGDMVRVLPDFFIGAHALVLGVPLLTRDPHLYRRYFPELTLITPETDHD